MTDDLINGLFQLCVAVMIFNNVRVLYRDREVKGISGWSTLFFFLYGLWNLHYYPLLGQWWSFAGGTLVIFADCVFGCMMIYYNYILKSPRYSRMTNFGQYIMSATKENSSNV